MIGISLFFFSPRIETQRWSLRFETHLSLAFPIIKFIDSSRDSKNATHLVLNREDISHSFYSVKNVEPPSLRDIFIVSYRRGKMRWSFSVITVLYTSLLDVLLLLTCVRETEIENQMNSLTKEPRLKYKWERKATNTQYKGEILENEREIQQPSRDDYMNENSVVYLRCTSLKEKERLPKISETVKYFPQRKFIPSHRIKRSFWPEKREGSQTKGKDWRKRDEDQPRMKTTTS
jgi:hypothetical protein